MFTKFLKKFKVCSPKFIYKKLIVFCSFMSLFAIWFIICSYSSIFTISDVFQMELFSKYNKSELKNIEMRKKCYKLSSNAIKGFKLFDDILESKEKPTPGKGIFFHVTTCSTNGSIILNARWVNLILKCHFI